MGSLSLSLLNKAIQSTKNSKNVTLKERVFVESAFKLQCYIHKNTLRHTAFLSAILPVGKIVSSSIEKIYFFYYFILLPVQTVGIKIFFHIDLINVLINQS